MRDDAGPGERLHDAISVVAVQRDVDLQAFRPGDLRKRRELQPVEHVLQEERDVDARQYVAAFAGIPAEHVVSVAEVGGVVAFSTTQIITPTAAA